MLEGAVDIMRLAHLKVLVALAVVVLLEQMDQPILVVVVVVILALAAQELLYLAIQLLIDLPRQLQDHLHLLPLVVTTYTLLIRLERLLFKEQI
jgi:hypothetical protein